MRIYNDEVKVNGEFCKSKVVAKPKAVFPHLDTTTRMVLVGGHWRRLYSYVCDPGTPWHRRTFVLGGLRQGIVTVDQVRTD